MGKRTTVDVIIWVLRIAVAAVLVIYGLPKLTGAEEAVALFNSLGAGAWFRYFAGVLEILAALLILIPPTVVPGAVLAVGIMAGALFSHLSILGFSGDMGMMAILGIFVLIASLVIAFAKRASLPFLSKGK